MWNASLTCLPACRHGVPMATSAVWKQFGGRLLRLAPTDNVAVATAEFKIGEAARLDDAQIPLLDPIPLGHKVAVARDRPGTEGLASTDARSARLPAPSAWANTSTCTTSRAITSPRSPSMKVKVSTRSARRERLSEAGRPQGHPKLRGGCLSRRVCALRRARDCTSLAPQRRAFDRFFRLLPERLR